MTIGQVEWKLDSLQPYTDWSTRSGEEIGMDAPAGCVVIVAPS